MAEKGSTILGKLGVDIGFKATHTKTITEADIAAFANVSGDFNPVHMSEEYAKKTFFGGRIAHGVIVIGLFSAAMAKFPGLVIPHSLSARFLRPVKIGDTITVIAEVVKARPGIGVVIAKANCINQSGEKVVDGQVTCRLYLVPP